MFSAQKVEVVKYVHIFRYIFQVNKLRFFFQGNTKGHRLSTDLPEQKIGDSNPCYGTRFKACTYMYTQTAVPCFKLIIQCISL
jgi:hypothetical protein